MYLKGIAVAKDINQGVYWAERAANLGYDKSQYVLGSMYDKGDVVPKDYKKALDWYTKAANQGNAEAAKALKNNEK